MISSEVQRTLVKSPPELWSELSDPTALARHLGALGEIRITRAEPESLVEWEADGTSGSVQIKPSGWGTRVTLSVNRELSTPVEAETDDVELTAEDPGGAVQEASADELSVMAQEPPAGAQEPSATAHSPDELAEIASSAAQEPFAPLPPPAQEDPEAAVDAIAPEDPLEQTIEIRAVRLEPDPYEDDLAPDQLGQPEPQEHEQLDAYEPVPRRGFFARLFGWRRRHEAPEQSLELDEQQADALDGRVEGEQSWPAPEEPAAEQEPAQEDAFPAEPSSSSSAIEALQARFTAMAPEPESSAEPAAEEPPAPAPESSAEPEDSYEEAADEVPEPPLAEGGQGADEQPVQARSDLAGELAAAEEVAAEEVTAVLTAVLDRLGAAHHRPFSRS